MDVCLFWPLFLFRFLFCVQVDRSVGEGEGRITLAQFIGGWGILTGVGPSSVSEAKSLAESEALKQKQVAVQKVVILLHAYLFSSIPLLRSCILVLYQSDRFHT